jgi:hypothetical protein
MTFGRLVLAVACGILLAEFVNGVLYEANNEYQLYRYRHRGAERAASVSTDPYQTALDRVRGSTATREQAIADFCKSTVIGSDNADRAAQQRRECVTDTAARMARDLE